MSRSGDVSFVSRFAAKFVEIIVAGLATAVSGYLIAHLSGAFSSSSTGPTPSAAVIEVTPSTSMLSTMPQSMAPISTNSNARVPTPQQAPTPQQEVNAGRATQSGPAVSDTAKPEVTRKHIEKAASAADSNRHQTSLLDRVRAALANVDANRKERLDVPPHQGDLPITATPRPITTSTIDAAASPARVDAAEHRSEPPQDAPIQPNPLPSVEIKSRPTSEAQSSPAPSLEKDSGAFSNLEQMLRQDPLAAADNPPRPPLPIGQ